MFVLVGTIYQFSVPHNFPPNWMCGTSAVGVLPSGGLGGSTFLIAKKHRRRLLMHFFVEHFGRVFWGAGHFGLFFKDDVIDIMLLYILAYSNIILAVYMVNTIFR